MSDEAAVKRGRGRPLGTAGGGRYGCKTKVVRVPEAVADNIAEILRSFEDIKGTLDTWESEIETSMERSKNAQPSERYKKAMKMLQDLRACLD